jgi:DNA topoisomerase-1
MNYSFTADIEKKLDDVADGGEDWRKLIKNFYVPFHKNVQNTIDTADRATGERVLGIDPESGKTMLVRMTRLGRPVIQIGMPDELLPDEKPKYANLKPNQSIETITMEEAHELFSLPKTLGEHEGNEIVVAVGRFGPYIKYGTVNVTLPRGVDPMEIDLDAAIEYLKQKQEADAPIAEYEGAPVTAGTGRFGPFLKWKDLYINVPKRFDIKKLKPEEVAELIKSKLDKESNRYIHNWPDLKLAVENGRWGPFIRFGKKFINLPKNEAGKKMTNEDAAQLSLEDIKKLVDAEIPGAFAPKAVKKKVPRNVK